MRHTLDQLANSGEDMVEYNSSQKIIQFKSIKFRQINSMQYSSDKSIRFNTVKINQFNTIQFR